MTFWILYLLLSYISEHSDCVSSNHQANPAPNSFCCALSEQSMEKVNLGYSAKNIPVPNNDDYLRMMTAKVEKFVHNLRWKAKFFLKPATKSNFKLNFGFKSTEPAPAVPELKEFEKGLINLLSNIKFGRRPNHFQNKLKATKEKLKLKIKHMLKVTSPQITTN